MRRVNRQMIAYGRRRRFIGMRGYRGVRFPLPFNGMDGGGMGGGGCAGCRQRNCSSCGGKRPTLGANMASLTWYNGQVLTFDLDDPAQKAQYDAIRRQLTTQPAPQPTTTIIYGSSALTPPSPLPSSWIPPVPVLVNAAAGGGAQSWLDQETIPGVSNKWLAGGIVGVVALASLRGRRR